MRMRSCGLLRVLLVHCWGEPEGHMYFVLFYLILGSVGVWIGYGWNATKIPYLRHGIGVTISLSFMQS